MNDYLAPQAPTDEEVAALVKRELGIRPTQLESLKSGAWSAAIAAVTDSGVYVVRFAKTPDDFHCDAHAAQYASERLPIPAVHGIGQLGEHFWCISDRMPGVHLDDLTSDQWEATLPSLASTLIAMRNVDSSHTSGYGGWDREGNGTFSSFADQLLDVGNDVPNSRGGGWRPFLDQHEYEKSIFDRGLSKLELLCKYLSADRQLIHEDTINYNVVVQNNEVSGIFDWGTAMWGDAIYDLAWFRFWDPWYPERAHLNIPDRLESMVGVQGEHVSERMQCCLLHIGLMHIRYNAFLGNLEDMNDVAKDTEGLL